MSKDITSPTASSGVPLRALNLFVLNKQFLLEESPAKSVLDVAERLVGFHAKRPQTPYLSAHARCAKFSPSLLSKAINDDRTLLRAHSMRGTVHMLPVSQYRTVLSATAGQLDGMYRRAFNEIRNKEAIEKAVLELIRKKGPLSHLEIAGDLRIELGERDLYMVINGLCTRGILVKSSVKGSWRSSVYNYELLDRWQPVIPKGERDTLKSQSRLIEWYLSSYGPSTLGDIAWWSGLSQSKVKKAIAGIVRPLSYVRFESLRADAYIFDDDLSALERWQPPDSPQVKLLPGFDPYVMAYIDRHRYISLENYNKVFKGSSAIIEPVILIDGWIVGTWKYSLVQGQLKFEIFERIDNTFVKSVLNEATKRMADFLVQADAEAARGKLIHMDE